MTPTDQNMPAHPAPGSEAAPSAHGAASHSPPMDDALVEKVARAIDPEVWDDHLPTPTRSDTISWHARRQKSCDLARAAIQAVQAAQWPQASPEDVKGGWTIAPSYLRQIQAAVEAAGIGYPQWEEIEAILLFQAGMPLPSFPKGGDNG